MLSINNVVIIAILTTKWLIIVMNPATRSWKGSVDVDGGNVASGSVAGRQDPAPTVTISPTELETLVQRAVEAAIKEIWQLVNDKLERIENKTKELEDRMSALEQRLSDNNEVSELANRVNNLASQADLQEIKAESREALLQSNDNEQYVRRNNIRIFGLVNDEDDCRHAAVNFCRNALRIQDVAAEDIEAALSLLHCVDENDPNVDKTDKIYKARPILNHILPKFRHYYIPECEVSLDEGMIPTKNHLSFRQYIKDKPIKWGIKTFILCESKTGYIVNAEVYTGKLKNDPTFVPELGVTGSLVVQLSQHYQNQNYCLYTDRFYTSVSLAEYLMEHFQIRSVVTALTNRKRFPKEILH